VDLLEGILLACLDIVEAALSLGWVVVDGRGEALALGGARLAVLFRELASGAGWRSLVVVGCRDPHELLCLLLCRWLGVGNLAKLHRLIEIRADVPAEVLRSLHVDLCVLR